MGPGNFTCGFGPVDAVWGKSADSRDSPASVTIPARAQVASLLQPCPLRGEQPPTHTTLHRWYTLPDLIDYYIPLPSTCKALITHSSEQWPDHHPTPPSGYCVS